MADRKFIYLDVETSGLDSKTCAIIQLSGIIEINGEEVDKFDFKIKPNLDQAVYFRALELNGLKFDDLLRDGLVQNIAYEKFIYILDKYINKYDTKDKYYLIGYNSHYFDSQFVREFFNANGNPYYGSYFWNPSIDVFLLAAYAAIGQRDKFVDFKLATVAKSLGIIVEEEKLHDSMYDVELTRKIFNLLVKEYPI